MIGGKEELEYLQKLNAQFIKTLRETVAPFVENFIAVHRNKVEDENDLERLDKCIALIDTYSLNEAKVVSHFKSIKDKNEKALLNEINLELAKVKAFSADAKNGKFDDLYNDCNQLQNELLKLEDIIVFQVKLVE